MEDRNITRLSKFLSLVLRHKPETIGLTLDEKGWADVETLLSKANANGHLLTLSTIKHIVDSNDKKRFIFSPDVKKIRASQGHSIKVDLQLAEQVPPDVLYHGTANKNIPSIKLKGIIKGERHHVHLSSDENVARSVGMRYGKPVVLVIDGKTMHTNGIKFYQSENGVWLTDYIAPLYITFP